MTDPSLDAVVAALRAVEGAWEAVKEQEPPGDVLSVAEGELVDGAFTDVRFLGTVATRDGADAPARAQAFEPVLAGGEPTRVRGANAPASFLPP